MLNSSTLRPGLLVSLKTSIVGNVSYRKSVIDPDHICDDGSQEARWETERNIANPAEYEKARQVRSKARWLISKVCSHSAFGLLCPESSAAALDDAVAEARKLADAFNTEATMSRIGVYVVTGRVAADDVEAVRAINSEVRDLLDDMTNGLKNFDVKSVREAANKARDLGQMLSPQAAERIQTAIDVARASARRIAQAAEQTSTEIDQSTILFLKQARTSFLDLDADEREIAAPTVDTRAIDLTPELAINSPVEKVAAFEME